MTRVSTASFKRSSSSPVALRVGGKGGGRPDMAQAGGTDPTHLDAALGTCQAGWRASFSLYPPKDFLNAYYQNRIGFCLLRENSGLNSRFFLSPTYGTDRPEVRWHLGRQPERIQAVAERVKRFVTKVTILWSSSRLSGETDASSSLARGSVPSRRRARWTCCSPRRAGHDRAAGHDAREAWLSGALLHRLPGAIRTDTSSARRAFSILTSRAYAAI